MINNSDVFLEDTMNNIFFRSTLLIFALAHFSCDTNDLVATSTPPAGLSASATSVVLLAEGSASIVISNGTEPYSVVEQPNTTIADAQLTEGRTLMIVSRSLGSTVVKIKDSSTPSKTVTISISVIAAYTTSTSGSLSFNSNRGDISMSGIGSIGNNAPTSGTGVIALSEFDGTAVYAYSVNSPISIDLVVMYFRSTTNLAVGSYGYPSTGKVVMITYQQNVNPNDSLSMDRGYILATSATANIETLTSSEIKGTFNGTGYYMDNGTPVSSQTISVTNGLFNAPIFKIGKKQNSLVETLVLRLVKRI